MEANDAYVFGERLTEIFDMMEDAGRSLGEAASDLSSLMYTYNIDLYHYVHYISLYTYHSSQENLYNRIGRSDIAYTHQIKASEFKQKYLSIRQKIYNHIMDNPIYGDLFFADDEETLNRMVSQELYLGEGMNIMKFPAVVFNDSKFTLDKQLEIYVDYYYKYYNNISELSLSEQKYAQLYSQN